LKHLTSRDNPFFKNLVKLASSARERKKQNLSLIEGVHLTEVFLQRYGLPQTIVVAESVLQNVEVTNLLEKLVGLQPVVLGGNLIKELSTLVTPIGVIAVVTTPRPEKIPEDLQLCLVCEGIQDPGNLGSILRSAAAAGVEHALLSNDCAFAWSPRVIRAGQGAHFLLSIHEGVDLIPFVKGFQGKVVATSVDAPTSLFETDLTGPLALLVGNEGQGLSTELKKTASHEVKIPMPGGMESLNAAAAVAVCLFERVRQQSLS